MWDESQVCKTWAASPALPVQRDLFFLPWGDLRQELGSREAGECHVNFGLCPLPQNLDNCFAFGDLTRLGPVAKVMCPPKFVLVLLEELRVTARSCSRGAFAHPRGSKPHSPWVLTGLRREGKPPLRAKQLTVSCRAVRGLVLLRQHDDKNMLPFQCHLYQHRARCFICVHFILKQPLHK